MSAVLTVWQNALGAEYAAVFGYGVLGPQLSEGTSPTLARACQQAHRALSEQTAERLTAAGQSPAAAQVDYPLPFPVDDERSALQYAIRLETAAASAWRYLIAVAADPHADQADLAARQAQTIRGSAQDALTASAVRAMQWRRRGTPAKSTVPFPGIGV